MQNKKPKFTDQAYQNMLEELTRKIYLVKSFCNVVSAPTAKLHIEIQSATNNVALCIFFLVLLLL